MTSAAVSLGYSPSFNFLGQTVYQKSFSKNVSLRMASVPNGNCLKGKCLRMATVRRASVSEWQVSEWQLSPNGNCRMASVPNGKCPKGKWRPAKNLYHPNILPKLASSVLLPKLFLFAWIKVSFGRKGFFSAI